MFEYQNTILTPLDRNHCLDLMIPFILAGKIKQKDSNIKNVSSHVGNNASGVTSVNLAKYQQRPLYI